MATANINTQNTHLGFQQHADIGSSIHIPIDKIEELAVVMRVFIALADECADCRAIQEGEPYEVLVRRFEGHKDNIIELASYAKELLSEKNEIGDN